MLYNIRIFLILINILFLLVIYILYNCSPKISKSTQSSKYDWNNKEEYYSSDLIFFNVSDSQNEYKKKCLHLFKKLSSPNLSLVFRPPIKYPPSNMVNDFIQNGKFPIKSLLYIDDSYNDSIAKTSTSKIISKKYFDIYLKKVKNNEPLHYDDSSLNYLMLKKSSLLKNKRFVVFGTVIPWVEALALEMGSSKITTLDYTRKSYEDSYGSKLTWMHVLDYLDYAILNEKIEDYDNAASFSSFGIEFLPGLLILPKHLIGNSFD